jgi:hypothetical protein
VSRAEFLIESNSVVVASVFSNEGSMRDRLYDRCEPTLNWTKKYKLSAVKPLRQSEYTKFGRQVCADVEFVLGFFLFLVFCFCESAFFILIRRSWKASTSSTNSVSLTRICTAETLSFEATLPGMRRLYLDGGLTEI